MRMYLILGLLLCLPALTGAASKEVPPELLKRVKDSDPEERLKALKSLSKLGAEAVPPLVEALKDPESDVQQAAAYSLRVLRAEPAELVKALGPHVKDASPLVRKGVVGALGKCGADALPLLVPAVKDSDAEVRKQAILAFPVLLQKSPKSADEVLAALVGALEDESEAVRLTAVQVLPRCGPAAAKPLLAASADKDPKVRANAVGGLGMLKPEPKETVPALAKLLKEDKESIVRQSAAKTLGKLGSDAVPPLIEALADKEEVMQMVALRALAQVGPEAKSAVPAVKKVAREAKQPGIRSAAALTLGKLGPDADPALVELLKDGDSSLRTACLQCFGKRGKAPRSAVPNLILALSDEDTRVRALAAYVLGTIGKDAREAVPALTKALEGSDERVRPIIEKALKSIQEK